MAVQPGSPRAGTVWPWLAAIPAFGVAYVLAWGSAPVGVALWTIVAAPVAWETWRRVRKPAGWGIRALAGSLLVAWVIVLTGATGLVVADAWFARFERGLQVLAFCLVAALLTWGVLTALRQSSDVVRAE